MKFLVLLSTVSLLIIIGYVRASEGDTCYTNNDCADQEHCVYYSCRSVCEGDPCPNGICYPTSGHTMVCSTDGNAYTAGGPAGNPVESNNTGDENHDNDDDGTAGVIGG